MSAHPTKQDLSRGLAVAGTIIGVLASIPSVASATETTISQVDGNPTCASLGADYREVKIEPVPQGVTRFEGGSITVEGVVFDWASAAGVDAVIVKGGPTANVYSFTGGEATSGSDFRAPTNPGNGQPYGLSHISFCSDGRSTTPTPGPCEPGGATTMPDGSSCTKAEDPKKPCEPGGPTQMADGTPCVKPEEPKKPCEPGGPAQMEDGTPCVKPEEPNGQPEQQQASSSSIQESGPAPAAPIVAASADSRAPEGQVQVLGASGTVRRLVAATARMQGPKRCVSRPFTQVVTGKGISRVTILVNGQVRTMAGGKTRYALRLDPRRYGGVMRVQARVEFVKASRKPARTFRMTVLRCAAGQVAGQQVRFAG